MKPTLIVTCLLLQTILLGQIAMTEIAPPDDFSLLAVRKSPTGEYFMQASHDKKSIYTSMNGQDWTKANLPDIHALENILFFSDGTPLLQNESSDHMIRRNGSWRTMDAGSGSDNVRASFIKDDTLFIYQDNLFAYSINKGQTFHTLFVFPQTLFEHSARLWKLDNHFVLHHSVGASDSISIFNLQGARTAKHNISISSPKFTYNTCGEILITDHDRFYRVRKQGMTFSTGPVEQILPQDVSDTDFQSVDGNYYIRTRNMVLATQGCNYNWDTLVVHDLIDSAGYIWVNSGDHIFLYDRNSDHFLESAGASNSWSRNTVNVNYALIRMIDESRDSHQSVLSSNALFSKSTTDSSWIKYQSDVRETYFQAQYSPDGGLYVNRRSDLQYSTDHGQTFTTIAVPGNFPFGADYYMEVLDNHILFIYDDLLGDSYFTTDNGAHWNPVALSTFHELPLVKLVGNHIYVALLEFEFVVHTINLATGATTHYNIGQFYNLGHTANAITDDGTVYFQGFDINNPTGDGLYSYRIGGSPVFIGQFEPLEQYGIMLAAGTDLLYFDDNNYYTLSGDSLFVSNLTGVPLQGNRNYFIAANNHLYITVDNHRIFRSREPLIYEKYVSGSVRHDVSHSCAVDSLAPDLQHWQVTIKNDEYVRINNTDSDGHFTFDVPPGTYTISARPPNDKWELCTASFPVTIDEQQVDEKRNFLAFSVATCATLEIDFSTPLLRRCFDNYYAITVRNTGPEASHGTTVRIELDPHFIFNSATLPPIHVSDHVLEFDLGILAVNDVVQFRVNFTLSCDAELGAEHCLTGKLEDNNICNDERSAYTECQVNTGSFDPNDKRVFNADGQETERVDKDEYFYYHIRFQNTGTDTAFTVRIQDPLSEMLDYSTLEMLSASHPYTWFINDGPALNILFENIMLPDSHVNEPASHGYVKFRIKPLPGFDYGTIIPNTAGIYFDFNDPVLTNTVTTSILPPVHTIDPVDPVAFAISPNPASAYIHIAISPADLVKADVCEVIDLFGRRLLTSAPLTPALVLDISGLTPGMYTVVLRRHGLAVGAKKFARL